MTQDKAEFVGEAVGQVVWVGPTTHPPAPHYTDTLDSTAVAGGAGDVQVSPAELDRYIANLQDFLAQIQQTVASNEAALSRPDQVLVLGPQIGGVARAVETAGRKSDRLMRTLQTFHEALSHDVAAVQAARQSYVGTDEDAALNIAQAGGAV
ncbi:MAG: hypothetical protein ACTHMS_01960 [Jatrophihabitans sp.]|uniref:hypothetical protein n=1 Tax=Jatrophihabitans sp. TaxID=1932789 RepID=UPI003F7DC114